MLKDASRRQDIPLFEDAENAQELPPPIPGDFRAPLSVTAERGGRSFTKSVPLGADSVFGCHKITSVALTSL